MERNFTKVGQEYTSNGGKAKVERAIEGLEWQTIPCTLPMMAGEGIKAAIKTLRIPKVSHVAYSHEMAPFGLYGIRGHFKDGTVQAYIIDEGTGLIVVATDFEPVGELLRD